MVGSVGGFIVRDDADDGEHIDVDVSVGEWDAEHPMMVLLYFETHGISVRWSQCYSGCCFHDSRLHSATMSWKSSKVCSKESCKNGGQFIFAGEDGSRSLSKTPIG